MAAPKNKPAPRTTRITETIELTHHLRRIVLEGDSLSDFPQEQEGSYVKVLLPEERSEAEQVTQKRPLMRSYTIQAFDPDKKQLVLDFVINRHHGPATSWARQAKVGDMIRIAGPGPMKMKDFSKDRYLLIGDLTSINAVRAYAHRISEQARIDAVIQVPTKNDVIELDIPDHVNLQWLVGNEQSLTNVVQNLKPDSETHVFMGLEAGEVVQLRSLLQTEFNIGRKDILAVGYWKKGVNADRFGEEKRRQPL